MSIVYMKRVYLNTLSRVPLKAIALLSRMQIVGAPYYSYITENVIKRINALAVAS